MHGKTTDADAGVLNLRLLNGFALEFGGVPVELGFGAQRLVALVALNGSLSRGSVAGTLWPNVPERRAHSSLRTTLWRLHRSGQIAIRAFSDRLRLADNVTVDAAIFTDCAQAILRAPPTESNFDVTERARVIMSAGELLPDWDEGWISFERERLRQLRLHALEALAYRFLAYGRHADALGVALEAIRIDPLRESPRRAVIAVHLDEGNQIEALRHYVSYRQLLQHELGVEPSPRLVQLVGSIPVRARPDAYAGSDAHADRSITERRPRAERSETSVAVRLRPLPARP